jgi:nicotinate-nucleotide pyrophosphorylase (carboxylating)
MLDNMSKKEMQKATKLIRQKSPKTKIEISGGVNLDNISQLSDLDVDFISIGSLTHSVLAVDIGIDND